MPRSCLQGVGCCAAPGVSVRMAGAVKGGRGSVSLFHEIHRYHLLVGFL